MIGFRHVLCPVDFSDISVRALVHAAAVARWYDAQLTVLHVIPPDHPIPEAPVIAPQSSQALDAAMRDRVLEDLRRAVERAGAAGPHVSLATEHGRAHEVVAGYAATLPADLVVMGTHGRGGFNRVLLGSVTERVLHTISCPVMTVPPSAPAETPVSVVFRNILCAVDFSPSSLRALRYALDLGRQGGGCVTMLHVVEYMDPEEPCEHVAAEIRKHREHIIGHARERLHGLLVGEPSTWCEIREVVAVNRAYREILERAAESGADLIVMGAQGSTGMELALYGSTTQHVARAATCPVLTVHA